MLVIDLNCVACVDYEAGVDAGITGRHTCMAYGVLPRERRREMLDALMGVSFDESAAAFLDSEPW